MQAKENGVLQEGLERRKQDLRERRIALEQEVYTSFSSPCWCFLRYNQTSAQYLCKHIDAFCVFFLYESILQKLLIID